jgi:peptidoglycan/LPS O-acetylase OafA/YrhL
VRSGRHPDVVAELAAKLTPLTEPEGTGWRRPARSATAVDRQGLIVQWGLLSGAMAVFVTSFVAEVWSTCDALPPGGGFTLFFGLLPLLTAALALAIGVVMLTVRRRPSRDRLLLGTAVGLAASAILVLFLVPGGEGVVRAIDPVYPSCGTNGLPTWWPDWLPS